MSIQIKIPGANFTKFVATLGMPHLSLMQDYFLFGGNAASSIQNLAPSGIAGVAEGAATYGTGFATLDGSNLIRSATNSGTPSTFICAFRKNASGGKAHFGTYSFTSSTGLMAYTQDNVSLDGFINGAGKGTIPFVPGGVNFNLGAVTYNGAEVKTYIFKSGDTPSTNSGAASNVLVAVPCKFGGSAALGSFDAALGITCGSVLTQAQLVNIYPYAKMVLASRGVTLL